QLASLRAMPGLVVFRPADAYETAFAWKYALENREGPTLLVLTRQKLPVFDQAAYPSAENVARGAYTLLTAENPRILLLASGSEVHLAIEAYHALAQEGVPARVVSMPSWELFESQSEEYRIGVIPSSIVARVGVEAGVRLGWERYLGLTGTFIGMHSFGASAPYEKAYAGFGITVENIVAAARKLVL
ncbi:MAG: transketolase, partial [Bacteroidetes bacterium]|nr:transketolase [Bacteroidota bacterium]